MINMYSHSKQRHQFLTPAEAATPWEIFGEMQNRGVNQKEGLQKWAKKRAAQLDSVGMSAEMEVLVIDLLEFRVWPWLRASLPHNSHGVFT
jgi:hypothetical protein